MNDAITSIREFIISDESAVIDLLRLNTPKYFAPAEELDFLKYLENEIEFYYVLIFDNKIVGCGGINFDDIQTGVISWDIIHPEYQGQSLGTQLLKYRIDKLKSIPIVQNIIVRTSQLTYKFYEKQNFKVIEIFKNYWSEDFDMYYMRYTENVT